MFGFERRERLLQERDARRVDAGVPLLDGALGVGAQILLLADLDDLPALVAHHAAVAERIVRRARRERDARRRRPRRAIFATAATSVGGEQRHVAVEDEDALGLRAHGVETGARGVARPALLLLDGRLHAPFPGFGDSVSAGAESLREIGFETFSTVADDHDHLPATGFERRAYGVVDERRPAIGWSTFGKALFIRVP